MKNDIVQRKISDLNDEGYSFWVPVPAPTEQFPDKKIYVKATATQIKHTCLRANRQELINVTLHRGRNTSRSAHLISFPVL